jgi:hypothetical protein
MMNEPQSWQLTVGRLRHALADLPSEAVVGMPVPACGLEGGPGSRFYNLRVEYGGGVLVELVPFDPSPGEALALVRALLSPLASRAQQDRYMLNATKDVYLSPEECLNHGFRAVREMEQRVPWAAELTDAQRSAIAAFGAVLAAHADACEGVELHELVKRNTDWAAIRDSATRCLAALGLQPRDE